MDKTYLGQDVLLKIFEKMDLKTKIKMMIATTEKCHESLRELMQTKINQELNDLLDMLKTLITPCKSDNDTQYHCAIPTENKKWPLFYILSDIDADPASFNGVAEGPPEGQTIPILPGNMKEVLINVHELAVQIRNNLNTTESAQPLDAIQEQVKNLGNYIAEINKIKIKLVTSTGGKKKNLNNHTDKELRALTKKRSALSYA